MQAQMLAPAAVLVSWSIIMLLWLTVARAPALSKAGIDAKSARVGARGQDLEDLLPAPVNWKAHNYTHLMEQPTLYYAVVVIIAVLGASATDVLVAWGYVALRILHSIWQATVNRIPVRLTLFVLATFCLIYLAWRALSLTIFA